MTRTLVTVRPRGVDVVFPVRTSLNQLRYLRNTNFCGFFFFFFVRLRENAQSTLVTDETGVVRWNEQRAGKRERAVETRANRRVITTTVIILSDVETVSLWARSYVRAGKTRRYCGACCRAVGASSVAPVPNVSLSAASSGARASTRRRSVVAGRSVV